MTDPPRPSTIVDAAPRWLGRSPRSGETVLVGFSPMDDDLAVCLALTPDREPVDEVTAMRQLVVDGAEQVAIVAYTGSEDPSPSRLEATLRFLVAVAGRCGLHVLGVLVVVAGRPGGNPGYWRTLPDPTRIPLPTPTEETS
jgi:hypothetical protein